MKLYKYADKIYSAGKKRSLYPLRPR